MTAVSIAADLVFLATNYYDFDGMLFSNDKIKNLGHMVYVTNEQGDITDFSPINEDNYSGVQISGTVSVIATNSNGEVYAIRQVIG